MDIEFTLYLTDRYGVEHEVECLADYSGEFNFHGVSEMPNDDNTYLVNANFAGIEWQDLEILIENYFDDYNIIQVKEMMFEAVNDDLALKYEQNVCGNYE